MKGFLNKRDVVVPLKRTKDEIAQELPPMAMQVAHLEMQIEKLMYRIQNLERRDKSQRNLIARLRTRVGKLEKGSASSGRNAEQAVTQGRPTSVGPSRSTASLSPAKIEPLSAPDFEGAAEDLTHGRH